MFLQKVDSVYDLRVGAGRDLRRRAPAATRSSSRSTRSARWTCRARRSSPFTATCSTVITPSRRRCSTSKLVLPAYEQCLKCSHLFNVLDSSGGVGVTERTAYILKVRQLAVGVAQAYVEAMTPAGATDEAGGHARLGDRTDDYRGSRAADRNRNRGTAGLLAAGADAAVRRPSRGAPRRPADAAGRARRDVQHPAPPDGARRADARAADRPRGADQRSGGVGGVQAGRRADAGRARLRAQARRRGGRARARRDAEGRLPRLPPPAARPRRRRRAARGAGRASCATWRFPKQMHWDAWLDDGRGELLFGRPIRWILFLYGGRVVPFTIARSDAAQSGLVQEVRSAAVTYGHRFLATSGRAGRAIKVRSFEEYRTRLVENFVLLDRGERHDKIARELDAHAQRLGGRVSSAAAAQSGLLQEVPDLVEYPAVVAGTFARRVPLAARRSADDDDDSPPALLPGGERDRAADAGVSRRDQHRGRLARARSPRNCERVLTARLRDAQFFFDADRRTPPRRAAAGAGERAVPQEAGQLPRQGAPARAPGPATARATCSGGPTWPTTAATAGRLAKADLVTDMVRELTELQGTMGGIYAREEGLAEPVWRAIYYHYLPAAPEADAPPSRVGPGAARRHVGGRVGGRQARHARRARSRPASGRPARATRSGCAARRTGCSRSSSTCPS